MSPKTNSRPTEITLPYSNHSQTTSGSPIQCIASRFWPEWNEDNDNRTQFELISFIMVCMTRTFQDIIQQQSDS